MLVKPTIKCSVFSYAVKYICLIVVYPVLGYDNSIHFIDGHYMHTLNVCCRFCIRDVMF